MNYLMDHLMDYLMDLVEFYKKLYDDPFQIFSILKFPFLIIEYTSTITNYS